MPRNCQCSRALSGSSKVAPKGRVTLFGVAQVKARNHVFSDKGALRATGLRPGNVTSYGQAKGRKRTSEFSGITSRHYVQYSISTAGFHLVSILLRCAKGVTLGSAYGRFYIRRTEFSQRGNGERKRDVV